MVCFSPVRFGKANASSVNFRTGLLVCPDEEPTLETLTLVYVSSNCTFGYFLTLKYVCGNHYTNLPHLTTVYSSK